MNLQEHAPLWPVSGSRILIGILWLFSLRWKLPLDFAPTTGRGLLDWLQLEVQYPAFAFYGDFVSTVVIPNFTLFAWIIFLSELLVGLSLLTGTFTRLGGFIGLLMAINLGIGLLEVPGEWPWSYIMLAMWQGTFVVTAAGRTLGVDGWLRQWYGDAWLGWFM
ncbi:MAG: TQO small subunit DoxD [Chloroflexi bacterium]|nr:TQO small subunit DoxD [Chloroflexota bacterium]